MRYKTLFKKGDYALIQRKNAMDEYAVVRFLDEEKGEWGYTCTYYNFGEYSNLSESKALMLALDDFLARTENEYISRSRLIELATLFKDGLIQDDEESAMEYFNETCEMEDHEKDFFGI